MTYPTSPEFQGPYGPAEETGVDAYGHPVNGAGRCEYLNSKAPDAPPPPGCPRRPERQAEFTAMNVEDLVSRANQLGVPLPPGLVGQLLKNALIPLLLLAEGYPAP